jgi:hypothetical protein
MIRNIIIKKETMKKIGYISVQLLDVANHISMLNRLYLNERYDGDIELKKIIKKKMAGYKAQDTKKNRYCVDSFITYDNILEKLVISRLKCRYCKKITMLAFENKREPLQWTLDRIDNSIGHSNKNTIICCLKCNLERRCLNDEKFKFTKQMRLIKKI